jgi:hypothetical protein
MNLNNILENVKDEKTFLGFAKALLDDRRKEDLFDSIDECGRGKNGWENHTIESFLEAAIAWADDSNFSNHKETNLWKKFALFLFMGKHYE